MAEVPIGDAQGCPPGSFSLFPPFLPTVIKQRLSSSRYAIIRAGPDPPPVPVSRTLPFSPGTNAAPGTGDSTPRPSSAGSTSTARNSDDSGSIGCVSGSNDEDVLAVGVSANHEVDSGLRWNRVNPALNLLRHAGYEAQQPNCESGLVRSLFLHSLAYLLSALPEDLTTEEASTLRGSLPEKLKPSLVPSLESLPPSHQGTDPTQPQGQGQKSRSYLHRLLAAAIIYFCVLLQYLMPYAKDVMYHLYRYDRTHRVTERVTAMTLYVAEKVGRGSVNLGSVMLSMYDGRPGSAVSGAAGWWLEGVAGGIYEGLGEGMAILGVVGVAGKERRG